MGTSNNRGPAPELSKNERQWSEFAKFAFGPDDGLRHSESAEAWDSQSAIDEARDFYEAVNRRALTIEESRDLIAVPPRIASVLLAYARVHTEDAEFIRGILRFRQRIAEEFEFLIATGPITEELERLIAL
jgi:hypothetical protein